MIGGRVDGAGTSVGGHMVAQDQRHLLVIHRMMQIQFFQRGAWHSRQYLIVLNTPTRHDAIHHVRGEDHTLPSMSGIGLYQGIFQLSVQ